MVLSLLSTCTRCTLQLKCENYLKTLFVTLTHNFLMLSSFYCLHLEQTTTFLASLKLFKIFAYLSTQLLHVFM